MQRPRPIEVKPLENYLLLISFSNGEDKIFDVKPMISGSWFGELQEKGIFNTEKISGNTVEWVNGQDICPDDLYYLSIPKQKRSADIYKGDKKVKEMEKTV